MTTINLRQSQQAEPERFSVKNGNGGFFFSLGILIIILLILFGLKIYVPFAEGRNKALRESVLAENDKLIGLKSLERVVDMQVRLSEIKNNLQLSDGNIARLEMTKLLDHLGGDLDANIVVTDFKYDTEKIVVSFDANNFNDVAKQILNFKKSDYFTDVALSSIIRNENIIACSVDMKIKK
ncbi:MAG: hypothetical protein US70_C0010G0017 [Parcubacteria group bacterium GW2011_GWD2_38_11]|nr:MAG: hypothetical protein US70_C0010G0017 [Parcubacteria group bacterium GW2011_GWD2_38_11]